MSHKAISLLLCLLIGTTLSLNLEPNINNPLLVNSPWNAQNGAQIIIRFSFPQATQTEIGPSAMGSNGLNFNQFIGVIFPPSVGTADLQFDQGASAKWGCALTDGTNTYKVTAVQSAASQIVSTLTAENNIAYCRIDDTINVPLKTGSGIVYKLTITLTSVKIASTNFLRTVSLFTSTSNNPEKMIIDYIPVLGTVALYGDYTTFTPKALDITNASVTVTQGPSVASSGTTVYPYNQFDTVLTLKSNSFITAADHLIVIKFPTDTVSAASSITTTEAAASDALQIALKGNLSLKPFGTDGLYIDGIAEDLVPNRQFKLNLKGWKSLDSNIGSSQGLSVIVYYKNTYSVLSHVTNNVFLVTKSDLRLTVNHPEYWDVYESGAWPLAFGISTPNDLTNGGWVVIQQSNTVDKSSTGGNKITFIPSTCDFSGNDSSFDNSYGKRPSCYPLRTIDTEYGATTSPYNGSGIFFYLKGSITANKVYKLNVWAFFDVCGADNSVTSLNAVYGTAYTVPKFSATIYKTLNPNVLNESRFVTLPSGVSRQNILAQSIATDLNGKCWNNIMYDAAAPLHEDWTTASAITTYTTLTVAHDTTKVGAIHYREISDWVMFSETADDNANVLATWYKTPGTTDLAEATTGVKYLYSTANIYTQNSYFLVAYKVPASLAGTPKIWQKTPIPVLAANANAPGKWYWQFPAAWFTKGNGYKVTTLTPSPTCYASWSFTTTAKKTFTGANVFTTVTTGVAQYAAGNTNFIGANVSTIVGHTGNTIDSNLSLLPPDNTLTEANNILRIVSNYHSGDANADTRWKIADHTDDAGVLPLNVVFFTSCVKWVSSLPAVTSLYTYIDVQIKWNYIGTGGTTSGVGQTISNIRLIKLFPETGVFQDFSKNPATNYPTSNPYISHTIYTASAQDSICLLELSGAIIAGQKDSASDTLVIWLFFGTLLETDYNDVGATYPVAPLVSGINVYGLQTGQPLSLSSTLMTSNTVFTPILYQFTQNNTSQSLSAASAALNMMSSSSYMWFMGSVLYFTSVTSTKLTNTDTETPFFVPYYCPRWISDFGTTANVIGAQIFPLVMASWVTSRGFNSFTSVNTWIHYEDADSSLTPKSTIKLLGNKFISTTKQDVMKAASVTTSATPGTATLKFSPYTTTSSADTKLYVFNGTISAAGTAAICTGHSIFLSSAISLDSTITTAFTAGFTGQIGLFSGSKNFYAFGKTFNKAILYGLSSGVIPTTTPNMAALIATGDTASANYYSGIKRPTVDSLVSNGQLVLSDRIAYSCSSINNDAMNGLTNYVINSSSGNNLRHFIMDWYRSFTGITANWPSPTISFDKTDVYKTDIAGNLKLTILPPQSIPAGSIIKFTANNSAFTSNTLCGLTVTPLGIATQCDNTASTISCTIPTGGTSFNICCYNVVVSTDTLTLATVITNFPAESGVVGISPYLTSDIYSAAEQIAGSNPFTFTTNNAVATDILNTTTGKFATITATTYSQVNQESGIGKVTFTISLPREPTRDMKLAIVGDMASLLVSGNIPRCLASFSKDNFGSNWDNGDALIDNCSATNIQSGTTPIVVTTKKMIYKCGGSYQKTLYISLWPVNIVNWTTTTMNKSFKVSMTLNSGDNIALNDRPSSDLTLPTALAAKPLATAQWDTLCLVSSVNPRIPGEIAEYTFDIDLDTAKASLTNSNPNEVTIFFPYQYYGSFIPNVMCYTSTTLLNCSFTDEGILNIRFSTNLTVGTGKKIPITIVNIPNPAIDGDYSFPCTVNNSNFSTGARTNLITGSGKMTGGINLNSVVTQGSLRFLQVSNPTSDKNPRNVSVHRFRIAFDNAVNLNSLPITIANSPIIHVYFPSNYKLAWYNNKPTASIDEYTSDATNLITKTSTLSPASTSLSGNRISIQLTQASYTFGANWRYWDITITNIVNPTDTTVKVGPPTTQTTRPFFITMTNSNISSLYRTFSNVNTYQSDALTTAIDSNIAYNRGNSFTFDNTKWVVDIFSISTQLNSLAIKAGRYLQAYFNVKPNTSNAIAPWVTSISLTDQTFKTIETSYSVSTSVNQPLGFYVGCPCGTATGYYIVNFSSTDTTYFASLSPVAITVDTSTKGIISTSSPPTIPAAGSVWVSILLSEPNFDLLAVNWLAADNSKNDETAKITSVEIPIGSVTQASSANGQMSPVYSIFSITSSSTTLPPQSFKTTDPNACFSWNGANTITFNISGQTAIIPSSLNLATYFKYTNADTDSTLTLKNSIKFNFTPPAVPIYIFCALACINRTYPADADIITPKLVNTNYLQFYSNIVSTITPIDIVFSKLVRGMQYHMRCIIQSTQGDQSLRTSSSVNIENYVMTGTTNSTTINIQPSSPQTTQCIQWQFLSEPGQETRTAVVNYCQRLFSAGGYMNNGCVICTYSDMSYVSPGLSLPTNITCPTVTSRRLRFLQSTDVAPPNVTADVSSTLTICPVPHPICTSDVSGNKVYADYFKQLNDELKTAALFKSTLNIDNVRLNTTVPTLTITDLVAPDITKLVTSITNFKVNGAVSWTASIITPSQCFWQISNSPTAPTFALIKGCTDASWCGKSRIGTNPITISTTSLKAFTEGTSYNIFMGCVNDIPMAQKESSVKSSGSFTIPQAVTPTPSTNTTVPTTSAGYVTFSSIVILLLTLILI